MTIVDDAIFAIAKVFKIQPIKVAPADNVVEDVSDEYNPFDDLRNNIKEDNESLFPTLSDIIAEFNDNIVQPIIDAFQDNIVSPVTAAVGEWIDDALEWYSTELNLMEWLEDKFSTHSASIVTSVVNILNKTSSRMRDDE